MIINVADKSLAYIKKNLWKRQRFCWFEQTSRCAFRVAERKIKWKFPENAPLTRIFFSETKKTEEQEEKSNARGVRTSSLLTNVILKFPNLSRTVFHKWMRVVKMLSENEMSFCYRPHRVVFPLTIFIGSFTQNKAKVKICSSQTSRKLAALVHI